MCLARASFARPSSVHSILEIVGATMVLIDAASNDDSNGGHIVILVKFGPLL